MIGYDRTLTYEQGDRFVSFRVERPPLTQAEARDLPSLRHAGVGGGVDTSSPDGVWQAEEASVFGFDKRLFSSTGAREYAQTVADHIGATLMEPERAEQQASI
jgi:hypothetical protein